MTEIADARACIRRCRCRISGVTCPLRNGTYCAEQPTGARGTDVRSVGSGGRRTQSNVMSVGNTMMRRGSSVLRAYRRCVQAAMRLNTLADRSRKAMETRRWRGSCASTDGLGRKPPPTWISYSTSGRLAVTVNGAWTSTGCALRVNASRTRSAGPLGTAPAGRSRAAAPTPH